MPLSRSRAAQLLARGCRALVCRLPAPFPRLLLVVAFRYLSLYEIIVMVVAVLAPETKAGPCVPDALRRVESILRRQNATLL